MYTEVDIFVGSSTIIDAEVFQLWVDGYSATEASEVLQKRGVLQQYGTTPEILMSDVLDHFRTFFLLEKLLHTPVKLSEEWSFQMDTDTQRMIIEKYYALDDSVVREILGKKLSSRNRKDLDEVGEKTDKSLKSCRRQFDNVKRVHKVVEEMPGDVVRNIETWFLLPKELAKKYAAVVFLSCNRFETNKRKLQYLTFSDFYHCSHVIMDNWTSLDTARNKDHKLDNNEDVSATETNLDVDREFLTDLRDVRILLDKEKEHKQLVCGSLKGQLGEKVYYELESSFKSHSRSLVQLACSLNRSRELKSLFTDLVERCIEPFRQARWTPRDLRLFLDQYGQHASQLLNHDAQIRNVWERYMKTITSCLVKMYHN